MRYRYDITVVCVITEQNKSISEAIESVLKQRTSRYQAQLLIVSDGRDEQALATTKSFQAQAQAQNPVQMKIVTAPGSNPVAAKKAALPFVEGKYLLFLRPEDQLGVGVLEKVPAFFEQQGKETDLVFIPTKHFGGKKRLKRLNRIFRSGTGVIDITYLGNYLPPTNSAVFRSEEVTAECFDENLNEQYSGRKMLLQILARHSKIGVLTDCYYMRRTGNTRHEEQQIAGNEWVNYLRHYCLSLSDSALTQASATSKLVEHYVVKEIVDILYNRHKQKVPAISPQELEEARALFVRTLQKLDDAAIFSSKCSMDRKLLALRMKYAKDLTVEAADDNFLIGGPGGTDKIPLSTLPLSLDMLEINDDRALLECNFPIFDDSAHDFNICAKVGETLICGKKTGEYVRSAASRLCMNQIADFKLEIPLAREDAEVEFMVMYSGRLTTVQKIRLTGFFPLSSHYPSSYFISGGWHCSMAGTALKFHRYRCRFGSFVISECRFLLELWRKNLMGGRKAVLIRTFYHLFRIFLRKPFWLCSDRSERADDNGEAFFEYLRKNHPEIKVFFVINGKSVDYKRLRAVGPVLKAESIRYKLLYLFARYMISSHVTFFADMEYRKTAAYNDIISTRRIFLQHGIIKDDLSPTLRRKDRYFSGFITSAKREYDSILHGAYGFADKELWLTGLPRFDRLYHGSPQYITFMPTWRSYLMEKMKKRCNLRELNPLFRESVYLKFYHAIFNDWRLLDAARKFGYKLAVLPHPQMQGFIDAFAPDPSVLQFGADRELSYRDVYACSALVITDYSSAIFDFCYLRKPVIYTQFDKDEFFANHSYIPGYFEYERDGFGEVEYDLDSTVARIIEYMSNGCVLKDKYRQRIDSFFTFHDRNNCQRVFDKIMELESSRR